MAAATTDLTARVRALPGMEACSPPHEGLAPLHLVGGAVRDLLRGARPSTSTWPWRATRPPPPRELAERLGGEAVAHERFGTATVRGGRPGGRPRHAPGASATRGPARCPRWSPPALDEDLGRRDFTVNAMAVGPAGDGPRDACTTRTAGGADLDAGLIRVLHERQLRRRPHPAAAGRALRGPAGLRARAARPSGWRARPPASGALEHRLGRAGARRAAGPAGRARGARGGGAGCASSGSPRRCIPSLRADPELVAAAALGLRPRRARARRWPAWPRSARGARRAGRTSSHGLGLPAPRPRRRAAGRPRSAPALAEALRERAAPSELHALLAPEPPGGAGAGARPRRAGRARAALPVRPARRAAGDHGRRPAGGRRARARRRSAGRSSETLRRKLDGELSGRDEELRARSSWPAAT